MKCERNRIEIEQTGETGAKASVFLRSKGRFSDKNTQNNEKADQKIKNKFSE